MSNYRLSQQLGLGGVAIGTALEDINDSKSQSILEGAWNKEIRYYDTSPWYGLTKSERRFGSFLQTKKREDFLFSTKVGRLFTPTIQNKIPPTMWKNPLPFDFWHDYSAEGTKKSIEESLK